MRNNKKIIDTSILIFTLIICISVFIYFKKNFFVTYSDFGYIYLQSIHLFINNFIDFRFIYNGIHLDHNFNYSPYSLPFFTKINNSGYLVYPPYYSLIISPFQNFKNSLYGVYLFQSVIFSIASYTFYIFLIKSRLPRSLSIIGLLLYIFCTGIISYSLVVHEYTFSFLLFNLSILSLFLKKEEKFFFITSGLSASLVSFLRLELGLFYPLLILLFLLGKRRNFKHFFIYWFLPFFTFSLILSIINIKLFGHPLGLRYTLVFENTRFLSIEKLYILDSLLFKENSGLFRQSPIFILFVICTFLYLLMSLKKLSFKPFLIKVIFIYILFIILIVPNDGGHSNGRYFFGTYPFLIYFNLYIFYKLKKIKRKIYLSIFLILALISLNETLKKIKMIVKSDSEVNTINKRILDTNKKYIILLDEVLVRNTHSIYQDKILFKINREELGSALADLKIPENDVLILDIIHNIPSNNCIIKDFCYLFEINNIIYGYSTNSDNK